ncbi:MAG TPA: hypothetical protein DD629_03650 [Treponema sp.]|nr:hypothetical protein [Treponema sp.]
MEIILQGGFYFVLRVEPCKKREFSPEKSNFQMIKMIIQQTRFGAVYFFVVPKKNAYMAMFL